jgi:hypothetical protein
VLVEVIKEVSCVCAVWDGRTHPSVENMHARARCLRPCVSARVRAYAHVRVRARMRVSQCIIVSASASASVCLCLRVHVPVHVPVPVPMHACLFTYIFICNTHAC